MSKLRHYKYHMISYKNKFGLSYLETTVEL